MDPHFARFGVSGSQWGVIRALQRAEAEGITALRLTELGERLLIRPPSVTGAISRLERMGLVQRTAAADDLRAKHVCLTDAGRELIRQVEPHRAAQIAKVMAGLTEPEQDTLRNLLDKMASHMQTLASPDDRTTQSSAADKQ